MASFSKTIQSNERILGTPSKNPAIDEKTTLIAKPALVIALKSMYMDLMVMELAVLLNVCYFIFKTFAKVVYQKGIDKKQFIKKEFCHLKIEKFSCRI
jgi:hypothetical protein